MLRETYPYYLASEAVRVDAELVVTNKYTGAPATRVARADRAVVQRAIGAAAESFAATRRMAGYQRQSVLQHVVQRVTERHEEMAQALAVEAGKPIRDARGEVTRLIDTFRIAAEENIQIRNLESAAQTLEDVFLEALGEKNAHP